jgi:8-oxo-dGTP pyrophosphatase MutT (NUDIX family)
VSRLRSLAGSLPSYVRIAWWGLVAPRSEPEPLAIHQAVVLREGQVLLTVRSDLWGWELPGGAAMPGESGEGAVRREVREETGLEVEVEASVGEYVRTGFRPHTAHVYRCRFRAGTPVPSAEVLRLAWFPVDAVPDTLFPWYRQPLADALAGGSAPVGRRERWGLRQVLQGLCIDLRMRMSGGV